MKKLTISVACALYFGFSFAQTTLTGFVTLQNSKGQSAFPAQVNSIGASSQSVESGTGKFDLIFDSKKPGQEVILEIQKVGYEVVNKENLSTKLPQIQTKQRSVKIYLCPKGQWQRYADKYYKINLQEIQKNFTKRIEELKIKYQNALIDNAAYQDDLKKLEESRIEAEHQAQNLAEMFAKTNLDEETDRYVRAHHLFIAGSIDSVLIVLNEETIQRNIDKANREILNGKEMIKIGRDKIVSALEAKERIIEEYMIKARAYIIKLDWQNAKRVYEVAVSKDSTNSHNLLEFAYFLYKQDLGNEALNKYKTTLNYIFDEEQLSIIYNNMALIYQSQNNFVEAIKNYDISIKMSENLIISNTGHLPYLADHYNNLGQYYQKLKQFERADSFYQKSLYIREWVHSIDTTLSGEDVAMSYNNLGAFYQETGLFNKAEKYLNLAVVKYKSVLNIDPVEFGAELSSALNNLGVLYESQNELERAFDKQEECLNIRLSLHKDNPNSYKAELIDSYNNIGNILKKNNKAVESEKYYEEGIRIAREASISNPEKYLHKLMFSLSNLGTLYAENQRPDLSLDLFLESINISEQLINNFNLFDMVASDYALDLNNLGLAYLNLQFFDSASIFLTKSIKIRKNLYLNDSITYAQPLAESYLNIAKYYYSLFDFNQSIIFYRNAANIYIRLYQNNPNKYASYFAMAEHGLGMCNIGERKFTEAEADIILSIDLYREAAKLNPLPNNFKVAQLLVVLAAINIENRNLEKVKKLCAEAIRIAQDYPDDPNSISIINLAKQVMGN